MNASGTFEGLPSWAKGALAVGSFAVAGLIGFAIYNKIKKAAALKKDREAQRAVDSEIEDMKKSGMKPTISKAQATLLAETLKSAFDGYGTKMDDVTRVFEQMNNDLDVLGVINTYGIREISSGRFNPEPNYKGGLVGTMSDELTGDEVKKINKILENKKIKFRF